MATFPYSTATSVNYLLAQMPNFAVGYSDTTKPTSGAVLHYINQVAAVVDMHLSQGGYVLPLVPPDGEEWLASQDHFLDFLVACGTAGLIGDTLRPAPAMGPGTSASPGNTFGSQFGGWLRRIAEGRMGLRAKYYPGSPAERHLEQPRGPSWAVYDAEYRNRGDFSSFWDSTLEEGAYLDYYRQVIPSLRGYI